VETTEPTKPTTRVQIYRPRHPERTVLYRALAYHFERFLLGYEERFEASHGYLRRCVEPAIHRHLDCGIFDHGVARVRCPDCRHEFLVAFSCKLRGLCPDQAFGSVPATRSGSFSGRTGPNANCSRMSLTARWFSPSPSA